MAEICPADTPPPVPLRYWSAAQTAHALGLSQHRLRIDAIRGHAHPRPAVWIDSSIPGWIPLAGDDDTPATPPPNTPETTVEVVSLGRFADLLGLEASTLKAYRRDGKLCRPDALVGARPGWTIDTIERWRADRSYNTPQIADTAPELEHYLTLAEVAAHLGISITKARTLKAQGALPTPDAYVGSLAGWSEATLAPDAPARSAPPARFYTKSEIAAALHISSVAIFHLQRAGRWPAPQAQCGRSYGWTRECIEGFRGLLLDSDTDPTAQ